MIKDNELRKSNLVRYGGEEKIVKTIGEAGINGEFHYDEDMNGEGVDHEATFIEYLFSDLEPILLTPEILEKCGFKQYTDYYELEHELFSIDFNENDDKEFTLCYGEYCSRGSKINIRYLHQLQNLYFTLTGEELPVNL